MNYSNRAVEYFVKVFGSYEFALPQDSPEILSKRDGSVLERFLFQFLTSALLLILALVLLKRPKRHWGADSSTSGIMKVTRTEDIPRHHHFSFRVPNFIDGLVSLSIIKSEGINVIMDYAKRYGEIFEVGLCSRTVIVIQNPNLIQKILAANDDSVLGKPHHLYKLVLSEWHVNGLIASTVPMWRSHRKMASRAFSYNMFPGYVALMNKHSKTLISDLISKSSNIKLQGALVYELICCHLIKIVSEGLLGANSATEAESENFHNSYQEWKRLTIYKFFHPESFIPLIWWLKPEKKRYDLHVSRVKYYIMEGIKKCQKDMELRQQLSSVDKDETVSEENNKSRSLVEEMLHYNTPLHEIYCEVGTILNAAHDTTIVGILCFLQFMGEYPEIQTLCRQEVDDLINSKTNESKVYDFDLTIDDLSSLKYLDRCVMETLRIAPPIPGFFRQITAPLTVDGFHFKSGTTFGFSPWIMHRNPEYYPNPDTFDPDRFLPENVKNNRYAFLSFSHGPRNCLGSKFAILEMKLVLARILRSFEIYTSDKFVDMKFYFEIMLLPERPFNIVLERRTLNV